MASQKPKVLILGGGFGGLTAAKQFKNKDFDVWIVDRANHHLFQPLLYQVASAGLSPGDIAMPIREILRAYPNITVLMGDVAAIDTANHQVNMENGEILRYDYLVIALGARHSYFGHEGWESFAPGLKTLSDALNIRDRILISFEKAERSANQENSSNHLSFIIVGGGPTGVEMAGAIAELSHQTLAHNFRRINPAHTKIYLIESLEYVLPGYPQSLSLKAEKYLKKLGITVLKNRKAVEVLQNQVVLDDGLTLSGSIFWAAGNCASPVLKTLNMPLDRQGRVFVNPDLSIPGHPEVFVIGDASCIKDLPLPPIAPVAVQQGRYVANLIQSKKTDTPQKSFRYFDKGTMATIGKRKAVAQVGSLCFSGLIAWLAWCFIHIIYLIGFRNRFTVFTKWFISYFSNSRSARLIYRSVDRDLSINQRIPRATGNSKF